MLPIAQQPLIQRRPILMPIQAVRLLCASRRGIDWLVIPDKAKLNILLVRFVGVQQPVPAEIEEERCLYIGDCVVHARQSGAVGVCQELFLPEITAIRTDEAMLQNPRGIMPCFASTFTSY